MNKQVRIFLVDDHPLVRDGLRARLESNPHFIIAGEAGSFDEAMQKAAGLDIDLALMDINLGGASGIALTARFAAQFPHIAVIILSMHDKAEYVTQALQAGARGYVLKDAPADDIVAAIEAVMDDRNYLSAGLSSKASGNAGAQLTQREQVILKRIADGKSNKQIALELGLSVRTVETHRLNIKRKLNIEGQAELIRFALTQNDLG